MILKVVFLVVISASVCSPLSLPPNFERCNARKSNFNTCLSKAVESAIKHLEKPIPDYNLPKLKPFVLPKDTVVEYGDAKTGLKNKYTNIKLCDFTGLVDTKASMDFKTNKLTLEFTLPECVVETNYEALGSVIFLPLNTNTTATFTFKDFTFSFTYTLEEYIKEGQKYFKLVENNVVLTPKKMTLNYKHLFKNQALTDFFNEEMTKIGLEIFSVAKEQFRKFYTAWFSFPLKNLLEQVPVNELFEGV